MADFVTVNRIVGKGNHSAHHIQKIRPRVEQICHELGLQHSTEANAGRVLINLVGGPAHWPPQFSQPYGGYALGYGQQPHHHHPDGGHAAPGQHHNQQHHPQDDQTTDIEAAAKKFLPKILKKLQSCCTIM